MQNLGLIKICVDPHCEAIYHNCPKKETKCKDCGGRLIEINEKTYWKKYSNNWFQYDFTTGEIFRPQMQNKDEVCDMCGGSGCVQGMYTFIIEPCPKCIDINFKKHSNETT